MEVEIPTRTAIIVMIVISVVYSTLTVVLCFCTCCHLCKQKLKKSKRGAVAASRPSELDKVECNASTSRSWSQASFDKESSDVSSSTASNMELHNRRKQNSTSPGVDTDQNSERKEPPKPPRVLPPIGQTMGSSGQASSSNNSSISNGHRRRNELPSLPQSRNELPSLPQTMRMSSVEGSASVLPSTSDGFTILTVHKSTLKRNKSRKEAEGELGCEDEKRPNVQDGSKPLSPARDKTPHKKPKVLRTESTKPLIEEEEEDVGAGGISSFQPLSPVREAYHKKPKVARTESTKPLMGDEEEESYDITSGGDPVPWTRSQPEISLGEGALVLENIDAKEDEETRSLGALQEDIMEIITKL